MPTDSSAKYNWDNKKRLQKKKRFVKHISLFKEEKEKKQQYGSERYKNLPEDEKQRLVGYRKKYYKMRKNTPLQLVLCTA